MRLEDVIVLLIELDNEVHSSNNALAFGWQLHRLFRARLLSDFAMELPNSESVLRAYKVTVNHHRIDVRFRLALRSAKNSDSCILTHAIELAKDRA